MTSLSNSHLGIFFSTTTPSHDDSDAALIKSKSTWDTKHQEHSRVGLLANTRARGQDMITINCPSTAHRGSVRSSAVMIVCRFDYVPHPPPHMSTPLLTTSSAISTVRRDITMNTERQWIQGAWPDHPVTRWSSNTVDHKGRPSLPSAHPRKCIPFNQGRPPTTSNIIVLSLSPGLNKVYGSSDDMKRISAVTVKWNQCEK